MIVKYKENTPNKWDQYLEWVLIFMKDKYKRFNISLLFQSTQGLRIFRESVKIY